MKTHCKEWKAEACAKIQNWAKTDCNEIVITGKGLSHYGDKNNKHAELNIKLIVGKLDPIFPGCYDSGRTADSCPAAL